MRRLDGVGTMPFDTNARWSWVRDTINKIIHASRIDDDATRLAALFASATYNPASIASGAVAAVQTVAVPNAKLGMVVDASFSLDLQGVRINAWVSADAVVSYQFQNPTAGALDLGSGTVRVRVWSYLP